MPGFYTEHRSLPADTNLSHDLAQHIFIRGASGLVAVATDRPHDLLSTTRKQWNTLIRLVQRERSSTLKASRIAELSGQISWMQHLQFTDKTEETPPESGILFATIDYLARKPPICATLYITQQPTPEQVHLITSWVPRSGVVVVYK